MSFQQVLVSLDMTVVLATVTVITDNHVI